MVTREEYLKAIDIINEYLEQLKLNIIKTPISHFLHNNEYSIRLGNILLRISREDSPYHVEYIEDIEIRKMRRCVGCGKKTLKEFIALRGY